MPKLSDTALRVILVIVDQTLGWVADPKTGRRKREDWISYSQFTRKTGRGTQAISGALQELENFKLIEILDSKENILSDKKDRIGKKLFYRFNTSLKIKEDGDNLFENQNLKIKDTKETYTKVVLSKDKTNGSAVNEVIALFKSLNPSYEKLFAVKPQRAAVSRMVEKFGLGRVKEMVSKLPDIVSQPYSPTVTTPIQMENKLGEIVLFVKKRKSGGIKYGEYNQKEQ